MTWTPVPDDEAARSWDDDLEQLPGHSMYQSYGWGAYKSAQGWTPLRWAARDAAGTTAAMAQVLVRALPLGTVVAWGPGGLAGPIEFWNAALLDQVQAHTRARRLYCRAYFARPRTAADVEQLRAHGGVQPRRAVSASSSMAWNLGASDEEILAGLGGNWRHNLHRSLKRGLRVARWSNPSPDTVRRLFETMAAHKQLDQTFDASALDTLLRSLDGRTLIYGCEDDAGVPLAVRGCVVQRDSAWDLIAATSPEGRRCYASYAVLWALAQDCRRRGITTYELSGVDPERARGVYLFKRGTGAREYPCLGEWEWTTSPLLARAVDLHLRFRPGSALT